MINLLGSVTAGHRTIRFLFIIGYGCPRSRFTTSIITPQIDESSILQQMLIDLRTTDTMSWNTFVFVHDDTVSPSAQSQIVKEIKSKKTYATYDLGKSNAVDQSSINKIFRDMSIKSLGGKFLIMVSKKLVGMIIEEVTIRNIKF
jgi:hypothetical protein